MTDGSGTPPDVPLSPQARERAIEELSARFANDELTLDELERRLERVYRVRTTVELEGLLLDLRARGGVVARPGEPASVASRSAMGPPLRAPAAAADVPGGQAAWGQVPAPTVPGAVSFPGGSERLVAIMSNTRRRGPWRAGERLDILGIMSETTIDLTQAVLPEHDMEIHLSVCMAAVKIIVPRGMPVVTRVSALMAQVHNKSESWGPRPAYPTLHVTGTAFMAEVKVVARDPR